MSSATNTQPPWYRSTLAIALVGSLLLFAALPPLALGWLGWIAPVPWLLLVRADVLPGRRPYRALWLAGFVFWLLAIHWLRLPHPVVHLGWLALSAWLAIYLSLFVGLSRVAVHRLGFPLWIAAPVVFTGLELARAHLLTGFLMASLAHTQVNWTMLIQISDLFGEYGVDFVIMLVASCAASVLRISDFGLRIEADGIPSSTPRLPLSPSPRLRSVITRLPSRPPAPPRAKSVAASRTGKCSGPWPSGSRPPSRAAFRAIVRPRS
jgi:apolipoprotein N-acyltransferase